MNNPSQVYESLVEELAAGELTVLQRKIFELLRDHPDGLDRYQLVANIYGYIPLKIDGNTDDRKIRKAIEKLRKRLFPIVSTSSRPGYRLDTSKEAAERMLAELYSRIGHMQEQAEAVSKFYQIPMPKTYRTTHPHRQQKPNNLQMRMPL
jgi:hypothetical protein